MSNVVKSIEYDYWKMQKIIDAICCRNPQISRFNIGKSCMGKDITALKINDCTEYVLFTAAFHGSEHITSNILLMFIEDFCHAYANNSSLSGINVRKALGNRGVIFVPRVNPDGCDVAISGMLGCGSYCNSIYKMCKGDFCHYNANLRGVDINHNFDAGWQELHELEIRSGIVGPAPTRFGGFSPHSEPETQAVVNLCRSCDIHHAVALHSQGEVIYWSYNGLESERSKQMAQIMATTSGYAVDAPTGLAVGGGFKDWFISEFSRPGFTIEVGKGKNPLPITDAEKIYAQLCEMLTIITIL